MTESTCAKGHRIHIKDIKASNGAILPCGCPSASIEARRAHGLPDHGAIFQIPIKPGAGGGSPNDS
jgi:hypothetical protein